jgi:type VI secretion system protein ImpA
MSVLDLDGLLSAISADAPCGDNLEYDAAFVELDRLLQGKPEVQYGDTIVAAEPPDWKQIRKLALELFGRTRDLRIAVHLARALIHTDGFAGFSDGLRLAEGLIARLWQPVHPQLDPDDDNDPTMRVNALATLCDKATFLRELRESPLVSSRVHGRFALRDLELAHDEIPLPPGAVKPSSATIEAAFMDVELAELQATAGALDVALAAAGAIESELTAQVGAGRAVDFSELSRLLARLRGVVNERVAKRGGTVGSDEAAAPVDVAADGAPAPVVLQRVAGEVLGREDVVRMLDKICEYYDRAEPGSPVPLLLKRAKRLVPMSFMDILRDLAPEGLPPVEKIRGSVEGE